MQTFKQAKIYIVLKEGRAKVLFNKSGNVRINVTLGHVRLTVVAVKGQ
jgi:hypothetical protein